jgi:hypothetical protein
VSTHRRRRQRGEIIATEKNRIKLGKTFFLTQFTTGFGCCVDEHCATRLDLTVDVSASSTDTARKADVNSYLLGDDFHLKIHQKMTIILQTILMELLEKVSNAPANAFHHVFVAQNVSNTIR